MSKSFYDLLNEQIGHEFAASHQYLSMAIWLDGEDLPPAGLSSSTSSPSKSASTHS